jgi:cell wall assembly regulator SMI1
MKVVWDRIHTWLRAHAPAVLDSLGPGATDAEIREAESEMDITFPDDVRAAYRIHDGQGHGEPEWEIPSFLYGWEWMCLDRVVGDWGILKSLLDRGTFADARSAPRGPIRNDWWHPKWIPLTHDGGCSHHCLDLDPGRGGRVGQVILWWKDQGAARVPAPSFGEWLARFADELEAGRYTTSPEYVGLVRVSDAPGAQ